MSSAACKRPRNVFQATANLKLSSTSCGPKVSRTKESGEVGNCDLLPNRKFLSRVLETKKGLETPGPDNYMQDDKAVKLTRYDNVHLGTGKKTTLKDINLTPGPGHYLRTDE